MVIARKEKTLTFVSCATLLCLGTILFAQESQPPADQQPRLPTRVRVSQGVMATLLIKKVPPEYPKEARKKHIQGTVVLHGVIGKDGNVAEVSMVSGDPTLAPAAIDAVRQWKYRAYLLNGHPVEVDTQFQVNFTLSDN